MKATVLSPVILKGETFAPGDSVEVDEITFRNLSLKGRLGEYVASAPKAREEPVAENPEPIAAPDAEKPRRGRPPRNQ